MADVGLAYGPGEWPVSYAHCADLSEYLNEQGTGVDPEVKARYERMAAALLWEWTGRKFGPVEVAVRPWSRPVRCGSTFRGGRRVWEPVLVGGRWYNVICGVCLADVCSCRGPVCSLVLPGPVAGVTVVRVDGVVVPSGAYRVDNRRFLVRLDGGGWPGSQDLLADPVTGRTAGGSSASTFEVRYLRGLVVPEGGRVAAGVLALELAKAACSDRDCALPQRVQSVTRQGVTMEIVDDFEDVKEGRTGIWLIDSWVASVTRPNRGGRVYSPDVRPGRVVKVGG